eukprot:gene6795-25966_t
MYSTVQSMSWSGGGRPRPQSAHSPSTRTSHTHNATIPLRPRSAVPANRTRSFLKEYKTSVNSPSTSDLDSYHKLTVGTDTKSFRVRSAPPGGRNRQRGRPGSAPASQQRYSNTRTYRSRSPRTLAEANGIWEGRATTAWSDSTWAAGEGTATGPLQSEFRDSATPSAPLVENWPATTGRTVGRSESGAGKPKLVKELEHHLRDEMRKTESAGEARSSDVGRLQVCKRRLQVHREVLKQIIANFHAPLQIRVGTFDQEAGVKMMEVADKHQEVFKEKDMKVRGLNAEISEHEQAAKMMLLSQTNELLQYKREMDLKVQQMDPSKAYTAERMKAKLVTDLDAARQELDEMKTKYIAVVPLVDHQELKERCLRAEAELSKLKAEVDEDKGIHDELNAAFNRSQIELHHVEQRLETWTPRPHWSKVADTFAGWKEATKGASSEDKLDFLIDQCRKATGKPKLNR